MVDTWTLGVFPVALLAVGLERVTTLLLSSLLPTAGGFSVVSLLFLIIGSVGAVAIVFGYAYHLGRTGNQGSEWSVAGTFLLAGLLSGAVMGVVEMPLGEMDRFQGVGWVVHIVVEYGVLFLLAGLAGVPLGSLHGDEPTRPAGIDEVVVLEVVAVASLGLLVASVLATPTPYILTYTEPGFWLFELEWRPYRSTVADLVLYGALFGSAYHLGRTGWGASPKLVVVIFSIGAVVGVIVQVGVASLFVQQVRVENFLLRAVHYSVRFALIGLAGVPLGRRSSLRDAAGRPSPSSPEATDE